MKRIGAVVMTILLLVQVSACSLVGKGSQRFSVNSHPPGALVFLDGNPVGATPLSTRIKRGDETSVMVRMDGYYPAMMTTSGSLSTLGIIDVVGGFIFLLPFFGLMSDAAWEQDPSTWTVVLVEENQKGRNE